jgi:hypothetical protein
MRKWMVIAAVAAVALVAAGCKVVVTPSAPNGWAFVNEGANGSGGYVNGPGNPPAGRGSALLTIDGTGREAIANTQYSGVGLSALTQLKYSTYQAFSGTASETATLAFDVDYDSTDSDTTYQGRLVYVPSATSNPVVPKTWQTWDTMAATPRWYSSASGGSPYRPIVGGVAQANPPCTQGPGWCTWADVLANYPHARIRPTVDNVPGVLLLRAGGPSTGGLSVAVDNLVIGIGSATIENNFEPGDGHIAVNATNAAGLGFGFVNEAATGSGSFVTGPNGSDGSGSANLTVDGTGGESLATGVFTGTRLDALSFLSYKTYSAAVTTHAPTLQFDVDYDASDGTTQFQGRLVFEPSLSGASITNETWQTWNPLTATSGWWQTGTPRVGDNPVPQACTQASPCSFAAVLAAYPNASIRPVTGVAPSGQPIGGGIYLKAGSGWAGGYNGNVDSLTVATTNGVNGTVTYDLEP